MAWNHDLLRRAEVRITFPEEGTFPYAVSTDGGVLSGTITVEDQTFASGIHVIVITDTALEPPDVTIKSRRSVIWKNRATHTVVFASVP